MDSVDASQSRDVPVLEENVEAIKRWEQSLLHARTRAEQLSDWITATAASGPVLAMHVAWFTLWIAANLGRLPGVAPFDAFPFPILSMMVSLEAATSSRRARAASGGPGRG